MALDYKHEDKNVERRPATTIAPTLLIQSLVKNMFLNPEDIHIGSIFLWNFAIFI